MKLLFDRGFQWSWKDMPVNDRITLPARGNTPALRSTTSCSKARRYSALQFSITRKQRATTEPSLPSSFLVVLRHLNPRHPARFGGRRMRCNCAGVLL